MVTIQSHLSITEKGLIERYSDETLALEPIHYLYNHDLLPSHHVFIDAEKYTSEQVKEMTQEGAVEIGVTKRGDEYVPAYGIDVRFHRIELVFETHEYIVYYDPETERYVELSKDPNAYNQFSHLPIVQEEPHKIYDILFYRTRYQTAIARFLESQEVLEADDNHVLRVLGNVYHYFAPILPEYHTEKYTFHLVTKCQDQVPPSEVEPFLPHLENREKLQALTRLTSADKLLVLRNSEDNSENDIIRGFGKDDPNYFFDKEWTLPEFLNLSEDQRTTVW